MTTLYDPVSKGFYNSKLHKANVPSGALEVTEEEYKRLLDGQAQGKFIVSDEQGNPVLSDRPQLTIDKLAARKRCEMDNARDAAFAEGLPRDIAGEPDVVQTRPQDQINLLGLRAKAEAAIEEGITEPVMKFRGEKNVTRYLTPDAMYALTNDALAHIESIYDYSWERKDAIDAALDNEDRKGIEVIEW